MRRLPAPIAPLLAVLLVTTGCLDKKVEARDDDTEDDCPAPFTDPLTETFDEIYNPDEIWRPHDPPEEGGLCFDCHLCANDGATHIDNTHFVCNHCHDESGALDDVGSGCLCGDLDCTTTPPTLTCNECHTDGCNGQASAEQMNGLCDFCHVAPAQKST